MAGSFALALDVSERHALEDRFRQSQKMEAVGQLTGGIAHEFNNLLQVVSGNLELLEIHIQNDASAGKRFEAIHRNVGRGAELTDRLLSFSRRQPLAPRPVDIPRTLAVMQGMLRQTLGETIDVEIAADDATWSAKVDPGQLENALLNLALNARDAMPLGGKITFSAANVEFEEPVVGDRRAGEFVEICVRDSGGGMSEEEKARAFEPFFTTKDVGKGTGLGLSMVYGFAQQSGGFTEIESEPGQGTAVRLFLPRVAPSMERQSGAARPPQSGGGAEKSPDAQVDTDRNTVLLVEDDPYVCDALRDQIAGLGYNVLVASDDREALSQSEHGQRIDLLFTDIVMPGGLNGLELARQLRGRLPTLNVIYTTGYSDEIVAQTGQLEDGALVLHKPYDGDTLSEALSRSFGH
ncbi:MAG: ATP-binding protein [Alphaproteobacteria bacterium]